MARDDAYATPADFRKVEEGLKVDDIVLERQLLAVSRILDLKLNEPYGFNRDSEATTYVYASYEPNFPIASTQGLAVKVGSGAGADWGATAPLVEGADFELLPRNAPAQSPPRPYRHIHFAAPPAAQFTYSSTGWRTQVTALHGWPEVPQQIWWATIELTALLRGASIFTTDRVQEVFDSDRYVAPQARAILKSLYQTLNRVPIAVG